MATKQYTRLRPHWRPTHDATPKGFGEWIGPDGDKGWVKILNPDAHLVRRVWEVAPEAKVVLRNHAISEQKSEMLANPDKLANEHANWWDSWLANQGLQAAKHKLVVEGINEAPIWEQDWTEATDIYNANFVRYCAHRNIVAGALQMNTGWPTNHGVKDAPPDWSGFERTRKALQEVGGYLCLHEYWDSRGPNSDDWGWNPGRFTQLPDSWRNIPILITECGYDEAVNAPEGTKNHGYIGRLDNDTYLTHLYQYDRALRASGWDVQAAFIFTHDWDEPWGTFDTVPIMDGIIAQAQAVRALPPVTSPPPPPPTTRPPQQEVEVLANIVLHSVVFSVQIPLELADGIASVLKGPEDLNRSWAWADYGVPDTLDIIESRDDYKVRSLIKVQHIEAIEYELPS